MSSWVNLGAYYAREVEGQTLAAIGEIFNRSLLVPTYRVGSRKLWMILSLRMTSRRGLRATNSSYG